MVTGLEIRQIQIPTKVGPRVVQAEVAGIWACHPAFEVDDDGERFDFGFWSVTHLPSGFALPGSGGGNIAYVPDLARLVVELLDAGEADPPTTMPATDEEHARIGLTLSLIETAHELYEDEDEWTTLVVWTSDGGVQVAS